MLRQISRRTVDVVDGELERLAFFEVIIDDESVSELKKEKKSHNRRRRFRFLAYVGIEIVLDHFRASLLDPRALFVFE